MAPLRSSFAPPTRPTKAICAHDLVYPGANIVTARSTQYTGLGILHVNPQLSRASGNPTSSVEMTPQYLQCIELGVPTDQRSYHVECPVLANSMLWNVFVEQVFEGALAVSLQAEASVLPLKVLAQRHTRVKLCGQCRATRVPRSRHTTPALSSNLRHMAGGSPRHPLAGLSRFCTPSRNILAAGRW